MKKTRFQFLRLTLLRSLWGILSFCILLFGGSLCCQVHYSRKADLPKPETDAGPFIDTLNHKVWFYPSYGDKWEKLDLRDYKPLEICGSVAILKEWDGDEIYVSYGLQYPLSSGDSSYCGDSVVTFFSEQGIRMLNKNRSDLLGQSDRIEGQEFVLQTLNGKQGYCVRSAFWIYDMPEKDYHIWGILDRNLGTWLIPPIFDSPFLFQNGIADVIYYGQKRKINEKGEFVEPLDRGSQ